MDKVIKFSCKPIVQYVSDIHLEFYNNEIPTFYTDDDIIEKGYIKTPSRKSKFSLIPCFKKTADILLLCGDIGYPKMDNYKEFMNQISPLFSHIFVIAGNHEFYNAKTPINKIKERIIKVCDSFSNITFLDDDYRDLFFGDFKVRLLGTTLWTFIPKEADSIVLQKVNDYNRIRKYRNNPRNKIKVKIHPSDIRAIHETSVNFLHEQFCISPYDMIVMSHHLPYPSTLTHYSTDDYDHSIDCAYGSDLSYLYGERSSFLNSNDKKIIGWIHGHTHRNINMKVDGIIMLCNPYGYPKETEKGLTGYNNGQNFEISKSEEN